VVYDAVLKSPAQLEKALKSLGKEPNIGDLVSVKHGSTLAPITDKRPALPVGADAMFKKED
jgi:hypothetical protein